MLVVVWLEEERMAETLEDEAAEVCGEWPWREETPGIGGKAVGLESLETGVGAPSLSVARLIGSLDWSAEERLAHGKERAGMGCGSGVVFGVVVAVTVLEDAPDVDENSRRTPFMAMTDWDGSSAARRGSFSLSFFVGAVVGRRYGASGS